MKKTLLLLAAFLMVSVSFARTADLFSYDKAQVQKALVNADALDHYVSQATVSLDKIDLSTPVTANFLAQSGNNMMEERALGIPGFVWGLVLGVVGILVVYLVTEDKEETKKALYGCIAGALLWTGCYFLLFAGAAASAASGY